MFEGLKKYKHPLSQFQRTTLMEIGKDLLKHNSDGFIFCVHGADHEEEVFIEVILHKVKK